MITGTVDDYGRVLLPAILRNPVALTSISVTAWIDTGFTGSMLLLPSQISTLGLQKTSALPGALADGSQVMFETYACQADWFGSFRAVEAIAGSGKFALIGVGLLEDCLLQIDYPKRKVTLTLSTDS